MCRKGLLLVTGLATALLGVRFMTAQDKIMAFKLLDMAQQRWRKLNRVELLPLVRAGVRFVDGVRQERDKKVTARKGKAA